MIALILPPGLVLEAVTHLLKSSGHPAAAVPWELAERRSAPLLSELGRLKPAIAVVDADVAAGMGLVAFAEALRNAVPGMRVVLLAGAVEPALAAATLAAGIDTVVLKSCSLEEVVGAVDRVREGAPATHPRGWAQTRPAGRPKPS